jgi:uncharacterized protein YcbX
MRLASINTYPIKGCYRLSHDRAEVQPWGLAGDRRWLLVDPDTGKAFTQRDLAMLTQVRPQALEDGSGLLIRTPDHDFEVSSPHDGELVKVTVWDDTLLARAAAPSASAALSGYLGRPVRLTWLDEPTRRPVDPRYARPGDVVSFADGYPMLLTNAASLSAVNDWLVEVDSSEGPLPMTRFRPNFVVEGAPAWAEDGWVGGRLRIGSVEFRVPKPCERCVVTTTDQESGVRGKEPLRTLGRHRNVNQGLLFAVNLIPDGTGEVAVGDAVEPF